MTVVTQQEASTSVLVVGPEASVRTAIARLLSLEGSVRVAGTAPSIAQAAGIDADVVIDETLLHDLKDLSIADFIDMVRTLPAAPPFIGTARHLRPVTGSRDMRAALSDRELQVVRLVAEGLSNKQISIRLKLSDKTVKNHISHILAKLNLSARTQVAVHALRAGLV
ncbi:MAG TPA: response regulator transcription factor [Candidatus Acidoferrum sp.]|jgi:DNA-binding NarL/FixJ family response regulator|nr:response regulator transcription factor [Candidatus Acidoferrum sp.]